jgi:hypothetical protein
VLFDLLTPSEADNIAFKMRSGKFKISLIQLTYLLLDVKTTERRGLKLLTKGWPGDDDWKTAKKRSNSLQDSSSSIP